MFATNSTILFQGDSITDVGRDFNNLRANDVGALGQGYVNLIASRLLRDYPRHNLKFINRGISGNRVVDLAARWDRDALSLKPDVISILIGVNDTWHGMNSNNGVDVSHYETVYRKILTGTKAQLPDVQLILCEPFILPCGVVTDAWYGEMDRRRFIVWELADEFDAKFVRFQQTLGAALDEAPADYWAEDGVHPTAAGHQLMADTWLATVTAP